MDAVHTKCNAIQTQPKKETRIGACTYIVPCHPVSYPVRYPIHKPSVANFFEFCPVSLSESRRIDESTYHITIVIVDVVVLSSTPPPSHPPNHLFVCFIRHWC